MAYEHRGKSTSLFGSVDKVTLLLYLLLTLVGVLAVFSASWVEGAENVMSFTHNYIKQITFLIVSLIVGVVIMLLERSLWHKIAYYLYAAAILALLATLLLVRPINGAKAWFKFGPIQLQTMEFAKIAIASYERIRFLDTLGKRYRKGGTVALYPTRNYGVAERYGFRLGAMFLYIYAL